MRGTGIDERRRALKRQKKRRGALAWSRQEKLRHRIDSLSKGEGTIRKSRTGKA